MFVLVPLVLFFFATAMKWSMIRQEAGMDESYFRWSQSLGCNSGGFWKKMAGTRYHLTPIELPKPRLYSYLSYLYRLYWHSMYNLFHSIVNAYITCLHCICGIHQYWYIFRWICFDILKLTYNLDATDSDCFWSHISSSGFWHIKISRNLAQLKVT